MLGLWRAEVAEREATQAQLFQSQKMEAVGQLTGGVAHDFNNLLTVIGGNADLLARRLQGGGDRRLAQAILQAAESGEALVRQLLMFARRQTLRPEVLDLEQRMNEVRDLLARSLREDIRIRLRFADGLWPVDADPRELELALLNISVNARDAMPGGGTLSIEARNVTFAEGEDEENELRGDYVALAVSDTGTGIDPVVLGRIFEPFFTTKEPGKGSGLGLSQVYGFAQQSGGAVSVRSQPGQGTTVIVYLPRAAAPAAPPIVEERPAASAYGTGTLLLVEDNPAVAAVTSDMLEAAGHTVHRVDDPNSALTILEGRPDFDLVLSDIVMPGGMSGVAFARELRRRRPRLPVILTTGYSEAAEQAAEDGFTILRKPYSADALNEAVGRSIARGSGQNGGPPASRDPASAEAARDT
jgi:two-component system NtrC family sensor kinase